MNYEAWNNAIAAYYFNPEKRGKQVILYCTAAVINEIGVKNGLGGMAEFLSALNQKGNIFETGRLYKERLQIFGYPCNYPPYIGVLAALILARTGCDAATPSYHTCLESFLANHLGYTEFESVSFIETLMQDLEQWSRDIRKGEMGIFRNQRMNQFRYVGKILFHTLLPSSEADLLPWVFHEAGVTAFSSVSTHTLRRLIGVQKEKLNPVVPKLIWSLSHLQNDPAEALNDLLQEYLASWDGSYTPPPGVDRQKTIKLVLGFSDSHRPYLRLYSNDLSGSVTLQWQQHKISTTIRSGGWSNPLFENSLPDDPITIWLNAHELVCETTPVKVICQNALPAFFIPENQAGLSGTGFVQHEELIGGIQCLQLQNTQSHQPPPWAEKFALTAKGAHANDLFLWKGVPSESRSKDGNYIAPLKPMIRLKGGKKLPGLDVYHSLCLPQITASGFTTRLTAALSAGESEWKMELQPAETSASDQWLDLNDVAEIRKSALPLTIRIQVCADEQEKASFIISTGPSLPPPRNDNSWGIPLCMRKVNPDNKVSFGKFAKDAATALPGYPAFNQELLYDPAASLLSPPESVVISLHAVSNSNGVVNMYDAQKLTENILMTHNMPSTKLTIRLFLRNLRLLGFWEYCSLHKNVRLAPPSLLLLPPNHKSVRAAVTGVITAEVSNAIEDYVLQHFEHITVQLHGSSNPALPLIPVIRTQSEEYIIGLHQHLELKFPGQVHFDSDRQYSLTLLKTVMPIEEQLRSIFRNPPDRVVLPNDADVFDPSIATFRPLPEAVKFPLITRSRESAHKQSYQYIWWQSRSCGWIVEGSWVWMWNRYLHGYKSFTYDPDAGTSLVVQGYPLLPDAVDHALVLASCHLPDFRIKEDGSIARVYKDISPAMRRELARIFYNNTSTEILNSFTKRNYL